MKRILLAAALAVAMVGASSASATTLVFQNEGDEHTVNFNGMVEGTVIDGLTSNLSLMLYDISGNDLIFNYLIGNSSGGDVTAARISAFGFNSDPDFLSASIINGVFDSVGSGNVPQSLPDVEFCATDVNCSGGGGGGVFLGDSGAGRFKLSFNSAPTSVSFGDFYVRYQSINATDPILRGASGVGTIIDGGGPTGAVPEPATWAMMLLGFAGIGGAIRHSRRQGKFAYA